MEKERHAQWLVVRNERRDTSCRNQVAGWPGLVVVCFGGSLWDSLFLKEP